MQTKICVNTRETEGTPSDNPLGNASPVDSGSNITPPTASPESLPSATEFNDTQNQPSPETSHSGPTSLGPTSSTDSPTQSVITVNIYSSSTSNQKLLDSLLDSLTDFTISFKQVDLGTEHFPSKTTESNNSPSGASNDDLEHTEIVQASLIRTSGEGRMQPSHFSHTQMESQNARQGETTQGAYGPQSFSSTILADITAPSSSTTADSVFSSPTSGTSLDGSGVSRRPSKQSLGAIFGSILGASIFAGCIVVLHRLCYRSFRNTGVQRHPIHSPHHRGQEKRRSEVVHPEISHFSKDS